MLWQITAQVNSEQVNQRLFQAAENGDWAIVRHQLLSGVNPNIVNESGETLFNKVLEANPDVSLVKLFLDKGAKPDEKDGMGFTPLRKAVMFSDKPEVVKLILEKKVDPNVLDSAVSVGNLEFITFLLDAKADVNRSYADGMTALHLAVEAGNEPMVRLLLQHHADPNIKDEHGRVPLFIAKTGSKQVISDLLIRHDADPKLADDEILKLKLVKTEKENEMKLAESQNVKPPETQNAPQKQESPVYQFLSAIRDDDEEKVKALLDSGVSPNASENGIAPLFYAISEGCNRLVEVLLEHNKNNRADPNMIVDGFVPLAIAADKDNLEAGKILIKAGAKPQFEGMKKPPLRICIALGHTDFALLLIEKGAEPEFRDADGGGACVNVKSTDKNKEIMGIARRHIFDRYWIRDPTAFGVVDERIRQINKEYDGLGFLEKTDIILQAMVTYDPETQGSRAPEKEKKKKGPDSGFNIDFGTMKFVDDKGHELKYMKSQRSDPSNPFTYKKGGKYFKTPPEVLAPPREADCDEVAATYANYLNIILGVPLDDMWMMSIHGKERSSKKISEDFDHGALVFRYNGVYYLADPVNDVFEKLTATTPEGLKNELVAIYEEVIKEKNWFMKTLELDKTDPEQYELKSIVDDVVNKITTRISVEEKKK